MVGESWVEDDMSSWRASAKALHPPTTHVISLRRRADPFASINLARILSCPQKNFRAFAQTL